MREIWYDTDLKWEFLTNAIDNITWVSMSSIDIYEIDFNSDVNINREYNNIRFFDCSFTWVIWLDNNITAESKLNFKNCNIDILRGNEQYFDFSIKNKSFLDTEFNKLEFYWEKKILIIYNENYLKKEKENNLMLEWWNKLESFIIKDFSNTINFWEFDLYWLNSKNNSWLTFSITWIKIKKLLIRDCNFEDSVILSNLLIDELIIINSNLWKSIFNWIEIIKLTIENATLNDCIFNWVEFPKNYELGDNYMINKLWENWNIILDDFSLSNKQLKDNYRQLKHVMDSNWNITEANNFFEKEMEYYEKELAENWFSQKRVILLIQKWISNYWWNWLKVIWWIFLLWLITAFISYCYMFNIKKIEIDFIKSFLFFLYPLYWLKKDFFELFDKYMLFWFMTYKTIYWILLWHLVVALKRTTKR